MLFAYKGKKPKIGNNVFIAPTATIIGDVEIGDGANIWYGAVLRGDMAPIKIGKNTNIQDNCTVHTDTDKPAIIGDNVTVGHNAVVHGSTVENNCLIGINAVILNTACVKTGSVIAAGSVVREGQQIGPCHFATGVPASIKRELPEANIQKLEEPVNIYLKLAQEHMTEVMEVRSEKFVICNSSFANDELQITNDCSFLTSHLKEVFMLNVYAATWCPHCQMTAEFLKKNQIEFNYIDIEKQPEEVVKKVIEVNGGDDWVVPTLEYKGQWREGKVFNADELKKDLQKMGVI